MTDRLRLVTGTAGVLASLRRSLASDGVTAPLPPGEPERGRTLAMLRPETPAEQPAAAAILATSGSTGRPRGVVLSAPALRASAEATHARLDGPGSWVLALPPHYVAGLMVLVRALVAGTAMREVDPQLEGLTGLQLPGTGPHYLSLVPTQLVRALADPSQAAALRRYAAVLVGGAAADPALLSRASEAGIRVVTTYGMSETCGGCVYEGVPLDGVEVTVTAGGRLTVGGPVLFSGYRLDPAASGEALVGGRLLTRDRGTVRDGRVEVLGRVDDVVQSGGLNVDLAVVERAVQAWAGDAEAAVVGVPHPEWGTEVVAVLSEGSLDDLRTTLAADLPPYALPRRLVRRTLPRTAGGKIDRRRLVTELQEAP